MHDDAAIRASLDDIAAVAWSCELLWLFCYRTKVPEDGVEPKTIIVGQTEMMMSFATNTFNNNCNGHATYGIRSSETEHRGSYWDRVDHSPIVFRSVETVAVADTAKAKYTHRS